MISFDNYQKSSSIFKWILFIALVVGAGYLLYRVLLEYYPSIFGPGPVIGKNIFPDRMQQLQDANAGYKDSNAVAKFGNSGFGYSADSWNPHLVSLIGAQSTENQDPSNDVQKYTKVVDPVTGKIQWEPVLMQHTGDYVTNDEFESILDRTVMRYNKAQLDYATLPSYIRNSDNFFGITWPNDTNSPLSKLTGRCVNPEDIRGRGGLYNSDPSSWGQNQECMY